MQQTEPAEEQSDVFTFVRYNQKFVPPPFGMVNASGAMCWFNSLLQMMMSLPSLNETMLKFAPMLAGNVFAAEYVKLLQAAMPIETGIAQADMGKLMNMSYPVLRAFQEKLTQMKRTCPIGNGQECADEGFVLFIEALGCPAAERLFKVEYELSCFCPEPGCGKIVQGPAEPNRAARDRSFHVEMFTAGKSTTAPGEFRDWILAHQSEVDSWKCPKCNRVYAAGQPLDRFVPRHEDPRYRREKLTTLREVIVVLFNKYQRKDLRYFPPVLEFKALNNTVLTYRLVCKVEHSGYYDMQTGASGGHYWAHCLRNSGTFWNLNDSGCSSGSSSPTETTHMVVYHIV